MSIDWTKVTNPEGFPEAVVYNGKTFYTSRAIGFRFDTNEQVVLGLHDDEDGERVWVSRTGEVFPD